MTERFDLHALGEELMSQASEPAHGRASRAVVHGDRQRAVLMAFTAGSELGEHEAPPAATLQVVRGSAVLSAGDESWALETGELMVIPQARHSLQVPDGEAVVLLRRNISHRLKNLPAPPSGTALGRGWRLA